MVVVVNVSSVFALHLPLYLCAYFPFAGLVRVTLHPLCTQLLAAECCCKWSSTHAVAPLAPKALPTSERGPPRELGVWKDPHYLILVHAMWIYKTLLPDTCVYEDAHTCL
jgi:hypothetical protein